ncbi:class 1b ribonucleoside-diphosphate reductase subunit alpha [Streptococcus didelphis]|uniref:class 1b ribonucleoside-diphosphate reductase subunit alpha n=1 Tax=Streptococcus didelphis TaxID=102886 RepID=UPI000375D2FF|nr:class 1b ribonucleoside-diphosphate reductase subunit alpha [Streptococcus didelphis]
MTQKKNYRSYNALTRFKDDNGKYHFDADKQAISAYLEEEIYPNTLNFNSLKEKLDYLVRENYYDSKLLEAYDLEFISNIFAKAARDKKPFQSFMGALKFYNAYALKTDDHEKILEHFEDRVVMNALFLAAGDEDLAMALLDDMLNQRFQPATPTFLNAGKARRGEYISCYLLRVEDNMESISRGISTSLQLSKRGGGLALALTNLREFGAPIKGIKNQATGIVPVMKLLEDAFSYANQLGQRQGAGAVYLHAHHPEVMTFLDTKRENADEKIRIKSLALGLVIPDITFELARENKEMALFSPYDIEREYGKAMSDISISQEYDNLLANPNVKKTFISARQFFQTVAELQFESGYPYMLFEDTVNNKNPHHRQGRIIMSNLCSEIAQFSTPSYFKEDLSFTELGQDISCNLGSLNIAKAMEAGKDFDKLVEHSVRALDRVSRSSDLSCAPSVEYGNNANHAIGLGAMNLHGFLATHQIFYDSKEALDFTDSFFYSLAYHAFKASCQLAKSQGSFAGFAQSDYADGSYFKKYTEAKHEVKTEKVKELLAHYNFYLPSQEDWKQLVEMIRENGLANSHLLAVAPTGSISYLSSCTPSLQPVVSPVEVRKEGSLGRVYVPAYNIDNDNYDYYLKGAYELGPDPIINIVASAQKHVDQAISMTLFMTESATTRDLNRAYIQAFKKKCASIYYVRVRQEILSGSETYDQDEMLLYQEDLDSCQSCMI